MKIIDIKQGSQEWLKWRKEGLGASDIPIIMKESPYKTPLQLWEEKCGFNQFNEMNNAMKHGILTEGKARDQFNEEYSLNIKSLCIEDDEKPYLKASLDGWDEDKKILAEIKCPTSSEIIRALYEEEKYPNYWYIQIQWQAFLTKPEKIYLIVWDWQLERNIVIEIKENPELHYRMKEEAIKFWNLIITGKEPEATDSDYVDVEDPQLELLLAEYEAADNKEKKYKLLKKGLKDKIVEFGDDGSFQAYGAKIKRCYPSVTYDYKKMKSDGIDIEKYKKEFNSIGFYKIMLPKKRIK